MMSALMVVPSARLFIMPMCMMHSTLVPRALPMRETTLLYLNWDSPHFLWYWFFVKPASMISFVYGSWFFSDTMVSMLSIPRNFQRDRPLWGEKQP